MALTQMGLMSSTKKLNELSVWDFTRTIPAQIILKGIDAKEFYFEQPQGRTCRVCGQFSKPISFEWANNKYWAEPVECNSCREKAYENYLLDQRKEQFENRKTKCGGFNNIQAEDRDVVIYWESIFDFENQQKAITHIAKFLDGEEVRGGYFYGGVGTGKSFLLKVLANELHKKHKDACFIGSTELCDLLRNASQSTDRYSSLLPDLISDFKKAEVLIIDDFGTEKDTDFIAEKYFQIFNYRYNRNLPTFFSSNVSLGQLATTINRRLASRIGDKKWLGYYDFGHGDIRKNKFNN